MRPSPPSSDDQLVADVVSGDGGAFAELYARYAERVFVRVTRMIGPGPDCEDVLQQVFAALFRALPRFRGDAQLSTFLHKITTNIATDHLRARGRRSVDHDPTALDALIDDAPTPDDRARRRAELRQIFHLLDLIKPDKRIAFVLVAVEGLSLAEAAEQIGESAETVKQRVLRARRDLIALMDDAERHGNRGAI
ncbi:MAG TPA: sigma-70 family RNA polymerase sigma factor [Kofleriaceae bacterium]|nr:sigma-70 family RNA polymerase sigma factor [Kofleriaceae bacterium]